MKQRLIIYASILAVVALVWFIPELSNTQAERHDDARAAAHRELETIYSLLIERILIERGDRLEPKLAAHVSAGESNRAKAIADCAEAKAEIDQQLAAIDRQIDARRAIAKEAIRLQKSLAAEK
jgi:hypothetical protein